MRRFSFGFVFVALPTFAFAVMLAGCGGKDTGTSGGGTGGGGGSGGGSGPKKDLKVLEPGKGTLYGKIKLNGQPDLKALTSQLLDDMKKKDTEYCMKGSETEKTQQAYRIGDKGTLGNVFVWIVPASGTFFKVDDNQLKGLEKKVKIRQPHCAFVPHCLFLFSRYRDDPKNLRNTKPTGQELEIVNDATIGHNTNWGSDNVILEPNKTRPVKDLKPSGSELAIKCNIHPWMKGYLRVVDTPYYAISLSDTLDGKDKVEKTDPKFGTYEIKGLPAGKVKVLAWHEECGYLNKDEGKGEEIDIAADKPTEKDFVAAAK